jgi:hypothetical protein
MHVASIIGSDHHSPPPPSAPTTAHRSTAARMRAPHPQSLLRLLPVCAHYLPNTHGPPPAHAHEARMRPSVCLKQLNTLWVLSRAVPTLESEVVLNQ